MTEIKYPNNNDNYQSFNNPQKSQYNYLFVSEQYNQNEYNIENNIRFSNEQLNDQFLSGKEKNFKLFLVLFFIYLYYYYYFLILLKLLGLSLMNIIMNL